MNKTWFGRPFCCLLIFANLHNLPCICINSSDGYFFPIFLVIGGIKVEKRKLRTWQNMVWKAFLLFGDFCSSSQFALFMHQNVSDGHLFHFSCDC